MRRSLLMLLTLLAILTASGAVAHAQPGMTPPPQRHDPLSEDERDLLDRGEIDSGAAVAGGLVGTFFGFGMGHALQGRFGQRGWIFTAGEGASVFVMATYLGKCGFVISEEAQRTCDENAPWMVAGLIGFVGLRVWEMVDVWVAPATHNRRVRALRARTGAPSYGVYLAPPMGGGSAGGGVAGVGLSF